EFYEECGGVSLYEGKDYAIRIVGPSEVLQANPLIRGVRGEDDISFGWYIIAGEPSDQAISIDFDKSRLGRCYDSFWDRHAIAGSSEIIALSFTELVERLYANRGEPWYWLQKDFEDLGDAYDDI